MSKCIRCKLQIRDDAFMCPLCHGVLLNDNSDDNTYSDIKRKDAEYVSRSLIYPDIQPEIKKTRLVTRIVVFFAIVAQSICILVNYMTYNKVRWSIITAVAFVYLCFTLLYSVKQNKSHQRKMIMQLVIGIFMIIAIDLSIGYSGWAFGYVIPFAIILMDVGIVTLMLINRANWQNYIMAQIWMFVVSGICIIPSVLFTDFFPMLSIVAACLSLFCLALSFVLGDKTAENEFRRRFHI